MKEFTWNDLQDYTNKDSKVREYFSQENCPYGSAITIGGFDGMHKGHQALFSTVLSQKRSSMSQNENSKGVSKVGVVTFSRSPREFKQKNNFPGNLSTNRLRRYYFENKGFDFCVVIDFSDDFSRMKGHDFLTVLRNSCSMQLLSVGTDFRCGRGLDTGVFEIEQYCLQYGLKFIVCAEVLYQDMRISSSAVRCAIQKGELVFAAHLLGYNYTLDGSVFKWHKTKTINKKLKSVSRAISAHKSDSLQVLPPVGTYPVNAAGFDTVMYVDSKFLHLEIPLEQGCPATVTKIEFRNPMKE
ncbi:MAG: hypothetical protein BKP49_09410 [Treponema sp. CETP13]|nr:MAG: hypothetical protein BKP49_09410 [Treponema sp. CETP13]